MQHFKDTIYHGFQGIIWKGRTYRMTSKRKKKSIAFFSGNKNQINIDRAICTAEQEEKSKEQVIFGQVPGELLSV